MENYNYWRDHRVQDSMFTPVWNVVEEGEGSVIISFDSDWVSESLPDALFDPTLSEEEKKLGEDEKKKLIDAKWDACLEETEGKFKSHNGDEITYTYTLEIQTKYEVCSLCGGSAKIVNPDIDCGGISRDEFYEDPEFEEAYFSGRYDQTCTRCNGKRVEAVPQFPEWLAEAIRNRDQSMWEGIEEQCAERAMGA